jgi:hypothetical protein
MFGELGDWWWVDCLMHGSTEEGLGKSAMAHQGVADSRYVVFLGPVGLHEDRVAEQVADADSKGGGEFAHNVEPSEVALVPLDLAQPVLRSSDQAGENALGSSRDGGGRKRSVRRSAYGTVLELGITAVRSRR